MNTLHSGFPPFNWNTFYIINVDKDRYERLGSFDEKTPQTFPLQIDGAWSYQFNLGEKLGNLCLKPMKWVAQGLNSSSTALKIIACLVDVIALPLLLPLLGIGLALKNSGEYFNAHKTKLQQVRDKYISIQDGIDRLQLIDNEERKGREKFNHQFKQPILTKIDEKQMNQTEAEALKQSIFDRIKKISSLEIDFNFALEETKQAETTREIADRCHELSQLLQKELQINMKPDKIITVVKDTLLQSVGIRMVYGAGLSESTLNERIDSYNALIYS
ncbi:MAG: hypothetical protein ACHQUC_03415 [Chlamydiales bacterium]